MLTKCIAMLVGFSFSVTNQLNSGSAALLVALLVMSNFTMEYWKQSGLR